MRNAAIQVPVLVWVLFSNFFGQVMEWLKLEFYGVIGMSHLVPCLLIFILRWQGTIVQEC